MVKPDKLDGCPSGLEIPEADEKGRGKKGVAATQFPMVAKDKLSHARTVLAYAPELVDQVIAGALVLFFAERIERGGREVAVFLQPER